MNPYATAFCLAAAALAGACADGRDVALENGADEGRPKIRMANEHHDGLLRAIRQTGHRCQNVDNAGYQEEYRNMRMWVANCGAEERNFAIYIAPNGDVQVRDCAQAGQLALPRCEGLPPPAPIENVFQEGASDKAYRNEF